MIQGHAVPYSAMATSEYKTGFKVAGIVGYKFGGSLRVEGELFCKRCGGATFRSASGFETPLRS